MTFVLLLVVVIAVAVIVGLALERRPASVWQEHLRDQREKLTNAPENDDDDPVSPHSTTLTDLMGDTSSMKNAYFDADRLPGVDRIERVTDRFEAMQEHRKAGKEPSAE